MTTRVHVHDGQLAYGEIYAGGGDPMTVDSNWPDGPWTIDNTGVAGEFDPNSNVTQHGTNTCWLVIGANGAGVYEVHFSASDERVAAQYTLRLNINAAQDCKIANQGVGSVSASGLISLAASDIVAVEFQVPDFYWVYNNQWGDTPPGTVYFNNFHFWIKRIAS